MPRLLIFNLPREASAETVNALLAGCCRPPGAAAHAGAPAIELHTIPGVASELFAVVHLPDDRRRAWALARHLNGRRQVAGLAMPRPLWSWLPAMAWG